MKVLSEKAIINGVDPFTENKAQHLIYYAKSY